MASTRRDHVFATKTCETRVAAQMQPCRPEVRRDVGHHALGRSIALYDDYTLKSCLGAKIGFAAPRRGKFFSSGSARALVVRNSFGAKQDTYERRLALANDGFASGTAMRT